MIPLAPEVVAAYPYFDHVVMGRTKLTYDRMVEAASAPGEAEP